MTSMTTSSGCGCGGGGGAMTTSVGHTTQAAGCVGEAPVSRERTRYFARQLVGADDLTQDQLYLREKARRHNRMLHGWGIVCGIRVRNGDKECEVVVESGYLLGPYGDEIQVDADLTVDLCAEDLYGNVASPCGPVDPWCADVRVDRPSGTPLYLAIAYDQCLSRPVRAVSTACGCDDTACEYSRVRDSYRIAVLDDLPTTYATPMTPPSTSTIASCPPAEEGRPCNCPACTSCPTEPWVVLADLTLEAGVVTGIDCDAHRRYVGHFGSFWFMCGEERQGRTDDVRARLERVVRPEALAAYDASGAVLTAPVGRWTGDQLLVDGVEDNTALGRRMKEMSIGEIASQGRDAFVDAMVSATSASRRKLVARQADEIWAKAADVVVTLANG